MSTAEALGELTLGLPSSWAPVARELNPADPLSVILDHVGSLAAPLPLIQASAAVYVVGDEVTIASVLVGWWAHVDDRPAQSADLDAMRDALPVASIAQIVELPIGPALRWHSDLTDGEAVLARVVNFAVPIPDTGSAAVLTFCAFGARPNEIVKHFDSYAASLAFVPPNAESAS